MRWLLSIQTMTCLTDKVVPLGKLQVQCGAASGLPYGNGTVRRNPPRRRRRAAPFISLNHHGVYKRTHGLFRNQKIEMRIEISVQMVQNSCNYGYYSKMSIFHSKSSGTAQAASRGRRLPPKSLTGFLSSCLSPLIKSNNAQSF